MILVAVFGLLTRIISQALTVSCHVKCAEFPQLGEHLLR
jgi:hypothetical protein